MREGLGELWGGESCGGCVLREVLVSEGGGEFGAGVSR